MKVLVVDDSKMACMVTQKTLKALGVTDVILAADGVEGVAAFRTHAPDVIFSDWNMPNMSGLEFLKVVRSENAEIPFVMVTTEGLRSKVVEAIQHGVTDYLVKPFTPVQLQEKVSKWVGVTC